MKQTRLQFVRYCAFAVRINAGHDGALTESNLVAIKVFRDHQSRELLAGVELPDTSITNRPVVEAVATSTEQPPRWASIRALAGYLRPLRGVLVGLLFLQLVAQGAALVQPLVARWVIGNLERSGAVLWPAAVLAVIAVVGMSLSWACTVLLGRAAMGLVRDLRVTLVGRVLGGTVPGVEARPVGDVLSRVGSDTTLLQATVGGAVTDAVAAPAAIFGAIALMCTIDAPMAVLVVALLTVTSVAEWFAWRRVGEAVESEQASVASMTSALQRILVAFRTVKASGTESQEREAVASHADAAYRSGMRAIHAVAAGLVTARGAMDLTFLVVLGIGATRVVDGGLRAGDFVAFLLYVMYLREPIETMFGAGAEVSEGLAAVARVEQLKLLPAEHATDPQAGESTAGQSGGSGAVAVRFDGVCFGYGDRAVLRDVSFTVTRGLNVLVGPSGAGKTTLMSMMERFVDADSGRVLIDDVDIRKLDRAELRGRLAYVQQEAPLLGATVRDAALYGVPSPKEVDLWLALRSVALDDWVQSLPDGLDTPVGERGIAISGGQRQRLAVARALIRNADILLLDEPTAQLDSISERRVVQSLVREAAGKIVLVVTHRLAVAREADRIVMLVDGRVRAVGAHDELQRSEPSYHGLVASAQGD